MWLVRVLLGGSVHHLVRLRVIRMELKEQQLVLHRMGAFFKVAKGTGWVDFLVNLDTCSVLLTKLWGEGAPIVVGLDNT